MNYIKTKRERISECNICGMKTELTWDHVPPKGILFTPDVLVNTAFNSIPTEKKYMKEYQSGIKFRTVCQKCNNIVLGQNDIEYKKFVKTIVDELIHTNKQYMENSVERDSISINCKINRVLRAICGHFLAARNTYQGKLETENYIRQYVMNENEKLENFKLYSWIYPYSTIIIARDFVCTGHIKLSHPKGFVSVISCFPISLVLSTEGEESCLLDNLGNYSTNNIDDEVEIELHFKNSRIRNSDAIKSFMWPMDVADDINGAQFVLASESTMHDSRVAIRRV